MKKQLKEIKLWKKCIGDLKNILKLYVNEKIVEMLNLDDEKLKPYFKLENVINGVFKVSQKLYGLQFEEIHNIDKYHQDVLTYRVTNKGWLYRDDCTKFVLSFSLYYNSLQLYYNF